MKLGAALPAGGLSGGPLGAADIPVAARAIEAAGYGSIWVFDAVGRGFILADPLMALTAVAAVTDEVELGTGIVQLPIRNVAEVAHRALTLELLAPGRLLFGVGPGSTAADFAAFGEADGFGNRFATFDRQFAELQTWLASGAVEDRNLNPWPQTMGTVRVALAGWHGRWVERAAVESSAWIASAANADNETLAGAIDRYRHAGGARAVVTNVQANGDIGPTIERLSQLAELGFDDAVVFDLTPNEDRYGEIFEAFAKAR